MTSENQAAGYRFGVYELDATAGELRKRGIRIRLQTQPMRVLSMLLERPGEVVSRAEIQEALWSGETFVDFEHGLNSAVNKIRAALSDSAANPMFLETVPRQGYRFIAPVERLVPEPSEPAAPSVPPHVAAPPPPAPAASRRQIIRVLRITASIAIGAYCLALILDAVIPRLREWNDGRGAAVAAPATWGTRILAGQNRSGSVAAVAGWEPDRFYLGGLTANRSNAVAGTSEDYLFRGERYGQFEYAVPVPPGAYRVTLHFAETWFGAGNDGGGGVGSRVFDVAVNGQVVLRDFDVMAQAGGPNHALTRTFEEVRPNGAGQISIQFIPSVQNAMVNAIEITAGQ